MRAGFRSTKACSDEVGARAARSRSANLGVGPDSNRATSHALRATDRSVGSLPERNAGGSNQRKNASELREPPEVYRLPCSRSALCYRSELGAAQTQHLHGYI